MKNMVKLSLDEYNAMLPDEVYDWYKKKMSPVSRDEMAKMGVNLKWFDIVNREEGCVVMTNENGEPELFGTYDNGNPILPLKPRELYNYPDVEVGVDNINKSLKESVEQLIFWEEVDEAGERITHKEGEQK